MLDNTKNYFTLLFRKIKIIGLIFSIINILFALGYSIYALVLKTGNLYVNIAVLILTSLYGLVWIILGNPNKYHVKKIYKKLKICASTVALGINVYSIYMAGTNANGIAIILATLMIIFWIIKVIMDLLSDLFMSEFDRLKACAIEDAKPAGKFYGNVAEFMSKKVDVDWAYQPTPKNVLDINHKASKINHENQVDKLEKEISEELLRLIKEADQNKNGTLDIVELITIGLTIDNAVIKRNDFISSFFKNRIGEDSIKLFKSGGPKKAGMTFDDVNLYCQDLIDDAKKDASLLQKYFTSDEILVETEKDVKKLLYSFAKVLMWMQKIIYLYGFKQYNNFNKPNKAEMTGLIYALSIVCDEKNAIESKKALFKMKKSDTVGSVKNAVANKVKFLKKHNDKVNQIFEKGAELANVIVKAFPLEKINLILDIAKIALPRP